MSVEEDIELRDLVAQTLESNGSMAKIRAQLRASIFLALDEDVKVSKIEPLLNNKLKSYLDTTEGQAMFCIVREFLEFFNLQFTISVYESESYSGNGYKYEGRHQIVKDLDLNNLDENTKVPLLLQLIKIAQVKTKSIEINLNVNSNGIDESSSESSNSPDNDDTTSNIKTEPNSVASKTSKLAESNTLPEPIAAAPTDATVVANGEVNMNQTFNLSHPTVPMHNTKDNVEDETCSKDVYKDDTYEDTSSIAEDSVALVNLERSVRPSEETNGEESNSKTLSDETINESNEFSPPVLKEKKNDLNDKPKMSQKPDKLKPKSSLSSLSDLPPLQMNKSRVSDILPSLYSKEFKDKSNLRELDKLFDMDQEYEEDFMCSGDMDLSLQSDHSKLLLDEEVQGASKGKCNDVMASKVIPDSNKLLLKTVVNHFKNNTTGDVADVNCNSDSRNENSTRNSVAGNKTEE